MSAEAEANEDYTACRNIDVDFEGQKLSRSAFLATFFAREKSGYKSDSPCNGEEQNLSETDLAHRSFSVGGTAAGRKPIWNVAELKPSETDLVHQSFSEGGLRPPQPSEGGHCPP